MISSNQAVPWSTRPVRKNLKRMKQVVTALLNHNEGASLEKIPLDIVRSPAIEEFDGKRYHPKIENCLRIYPQDNDSEGFFVAKIKKPGNVITAGSENY
jgi:hypothetical protein